MLDATVARSWKIACAADNERLNRPPDSCLFNYSPMKKIRVAQKNWKNLETVLFCLPLRICFATEQNACVRALATETTKKKKKRRETCKTNERQNVVNNVRVVIWFVLALIWLSVGALKSVDFRTVRIRVCTRLFRQLKCFETDMKTKLVAMYTGIWISLFLCRSLARLRRQFKRSLWTRSNVNNARAVIDRRSERERAMHCASCKQR